MSKPHLSEFLNEMRAPTPPLPDYDQDKVDQAVLALLYLTLHQPGPYSAWKGFDWVTLDRLHAKGMIGDSKNKLVALTDDGVADEAAAFRRLVGLPPADYEHDPQVIGPSVPRRAADVRNDTVYALVACVGLLS